MKISFHGAARNVTGSCHLLTCGKTKILVDCGLYQGRNEFNAENDQAFGFEPSEIDYLLLTHAHLDHCGRIPLLISRGFKGEILTTAATRELTKLILLDSAHIQEDDARWMNKRASRRGDNKKPYQPLYTTIDALNSLDYFGRVINYAEPIQLNANITVSFIEAGHILGSACVFIELQEGTDKRSVLFSGDLGYSNRAILRNPAKPPKADVVVMETTYGDRSHKQLEPSIEEMYAAILETFDRGGNVIIPTFALERAQEILYFLREGVEKKILSSAMQVFLDSPMAISATEIFKSHPECYDKETRDFFNSGKDPFGWPGLHYTKETATSMALNQIQGGAIILAGSGMCTGGRVKHHLKHNLWRRNSSVIFVGFAAQGTLARRIIDGEKAVKIFGDDISVNASIYTIGGFSAHADCNELLAWHGQTGNPEKTFLVHGEESAMEAFSASINSTKVLMPTLNEEFNL